MIRGKTSGVSDALRYFCVHVCVMVSHNIAFYIFTVLCKNVYKFNFFKYIQGSQYQRLAVELQPMIILCVLIISGCGWNC